MPWPAGAIAPGGAWAYTLGEVMESNELTIAVLREIRDSVREVRAGVDQTNARIDQTNARLDQTINRLDQTNARLDQTINRVDQTNDRLDQTIVRLDRLERRQVESETRIATELIEVANAVRNVKELLERQAADRGKLDDHERRITALEARVES